MRNVWIAGFLSATLAGCGGGGGDTTPPNTITELEGTWIYAGDGKKTGGTCGLDLHGNYSTRITLKFAGNQYSAKQEDCIILIGNTGGYLETKQGSGTFSIGDITNASTDPNYRLRALDLMVSPTFYTSYNLIGSSLKVAIPFQSYDGSTPDKRAFQTGSYFDPITRKSIEAPTLTKM